MFFVRQDHEAHAVVTICNRRNVYETIAIVLVFCLSIMLPTRALAQFALFDDVPPNHWAFSFVEAFAGSGMTSGCGYGIYCPAAPVSRAQLAVFLERGMHGSAYRPPASTGNVFLDIGSGDFAAAFIEQLFLDGITAGCGNGNYCPDAPVTRDQMAVFALRAKHGSSYSPPAASGVFNDVPLNHWAVRWIEQLAAEGITNGCGSSNYCPDTPIDRAQMAVFLVRAFDMPAAPEWCCSDVTAALILRDTFGQTATSFVQSEEIEFVLAVTNNANVATKLFYNDGYTQDFYVTSSAGTEVWRWADDKVFFPSFTDIVIPPGETLEISATWDQKLSDGTTIEIGSYTAFGSMLYSATEGSIEFTVQ